MASFFRIYDRMQEEKETLLDDPIANTVDGNGDTPLLDTGEDTKSMEVIRNGLSLDKNFWDNFIKICNNDGLADLLDVKSSQMSEWVSRINAVLKRVQEADRRGKKNTMLPTGDSFPKTRGGGRDEGPVTYPNDTNPTP